ncbi:taste receptor type 2 member 41-like [Rana temporaria]|uniref:taste receptor type 2 member 41-like n=1 Tax=Rana temporaria TaxID=8407 RepID=UPI001AAC90A9|nr:taste receptor type 2 member 41-like [Rana temporaria]
MSPLWWIWLAFCLLECVVAIYLNSYIVFFHGRSLTEGGKRNPVSLILIVMGINKMAMKCTWIVNDLKFWLPDIFDSLSSVVLLSFHIHFSYWLTAWLSIYYSIFITNFSHQMFLWIKRNLLAFLPQVLLLTGVVSLAIALSYMWSHKVPSPIHYSTNGTQNVSSIVEDVSLMSFYLIVSISLGSCLSFTAIAISLVVSLSSLLKHVNNISRSGFNVQVHVTLIKSMAVFLILSVLSFFCYLINFIKMFKAPDPLYVVIQLLMLIIPTMESVVIIIASPKLRKNILG